MRWAVTRRGLRAWATHGFAAFGALALLLQSYQAIWNRSLFPSHSLAVAAATAAGSLLYGLVRARPGRAVTRDLRYPRCRVEIVPGDLFDEQDAHLVVGFTDVFDTDVTDDRIINARSVQGQFLHRVHGGDVAALDTQLSAALDGVPGAVTVRREDKPLGKLSRYPIGTVAVLGNPRRSYFCVAYSTMTPALVAQSSGDELWLSLSRVWAAAHRHGQQGRLAMPVIGAGLARFDALDRQGLIQLILLSFVAASRQRLITTRLSIVVPPQEFDDLDRLELQAYLDSL
ncbi:macro domain-containing protein [Dactylosporangium cerinum]|uniref:Macro domain-containing protein n=1 Tax=Dactylosporangium cerinum TaxID=1434730 RepID=A0ABV9WKA2_9ACTN